MHIHTHYTHSPFSHFLAVTIKPLSYLSHKDGKKLEKLALPESAVASAVLAQVVDGLVELGCEPCNEVRAEDYSEISATLAG